MKTRTEFIIWIELGDPVTDGDIERLVETAKQYAKDFTQGKPDIDAYLAEDCLGIFVAALSEPYMAERDGKYIRSAVRKALSEAGMLP